MGKWPSTQLGLRLARSEEPSRSDVRRFTAHALSIGSLRLIVARPTSASFRGQQVRWYPQSALRLRPAWRPLSAAGTLTIGPAQRTQRHRSWPNRNAPPVAKPQPAAPPVGETARARLSTSQMPLTPKRTKSDASTSVHGLPTLLPTKAEAERSVPGKPTSAGQLWTGMPGRPRRRR